jgi:hypothetical protein
MLGGSHFWEEISNSGSFNISRIKEPLGTSTSKMQNAKWEAKFKGLKLNESQI